MQILLDTSAAPARLKEERGEECTPLIMQCFSLAKVLYGLNIATYSMILQLRPAHRVQLIFFQALPELKKAMESPWESALLLPRILLLVM